ncbi:hypothetical protein DFH09DRAFT_1025215 [Mycena vulgaris]|nr:hypothetical protein DFH09DRAFT_1025215 [Mycena vulgaris]
MEKLLEERTSLDTDIRKHEGAISPLRRMPTELLSLIFKYMLPPYATPRVDPGPWAISAVCSRWRTIVLSQPALWSTIVLDFTDDPRPVIETEVALKAHLRHSSESPLDITFITSSTSDSREGEIEMLRILAWHCARWETLTISGPEELYVSLKLGGVRGNLPLLRQLHVQVHATDDQEFDPIDIFEFCPRLEEAFINEGPYGDARIAAALPLSQLLRFSGSNPWTRHLNTLRSASNLVDCVLHCVETWELPGGTVTLPHRHIASPSPPVIIENRGTRLPGYPRTAGAVLLRSVWLPVFLFASAA